MRQLDLLLPVMAARMDECAEKGFDAVDPNNMNGFDNDTGFPLTQEDALNYQRALMLSPTLTDNSIQIPKSSWFRSVRESGLTFPSRLQVEIGKTIAMIHRDNRSKRSSVNVDILTPSKMSHKLSDKLGHPVVTLEELAELYDVDR